MKTLCYTHMCVDLILLCDVYIYASNVFSYFDSCHRRLRRAVAVAIMLIAIRSGYM